MIPHLFYYQLVILGLLWLCVMLHLTWPSRAAVSPQKPVEPEPIKPKRKHSIESKPFEGLTQKPPCALCAHEAAHPTPSSPVRPDPMPPTHRRPRAVDTSRHFCPHPHCDYRGWLGLGNLRANGHPSGGPWRQFHCRLPDSNRAKNSAKASRLLDTSLSSLKTLGIYLWSTDRWLCSPSLLQCSRAPAYA